LRRAYLDRIRVPWRKATTALSEGRNWAFGRRGDIMSEYQYYEFQAIDRPLTVSQMKELRGHSGRAMITPSRP